MKSITAYHGINYMLLAQVLAAFILVLYHATKHV
ncbi:hypothetical protein [Salmonella phage PHA46]